MIRVLFLLVFLAPISCVTKPVIPQPPETVSSSSRVERSFWGKGDADLIIRALVQELREEGYSVGGRSAEDDGTEVSTVVKAPNSAGDLHVSASQAGEWVRFRVVGSSPKNGEEDQAIVSGFVQDTVARIERILDR